MTDATTILKILLQAAAAGFIAGAIVRALTKA